MLLFIDEFYSGFTLCSKEQSFIETNKVLYKGLILLQLEKKIYLLLYKNVLGIRVEGANEKITFHRNYFCVMFSGYNLINSKIPLTYSFEECF